MKLIYLKSALKCGSFDVAIDIKIQFFRVLVTIEPGRSLLRFVTTNCLKKGNKTYFQTNEPHLIQSLYDHPFHKKPWKPWGIT